MYRWVEHTGELELEITAGSERAVFSEGLAALGELLAERAAGESEGRELVHEVSVSAPDRATLLADWLGELAFLAETQGLVPERLDRLELSPNRLEAKVAGTRGSPAHLVKGVTYHRLEMQRDGETWRARVILDV
jgi:SHS2 domain-containing protein